VISLFLIPLYVSLTTTGLMNRPIQLVSSQPYTAFEFQNSHTIDRIAESISGYGRANAAWTLGTINARAAAPFIELGLSAVAIGGFSGNDPIFDLESFKIMVHRDKMRYFLMPDRVHMQNLMGMNQESILTYIRNNWDDISWEWGLPQGFAYANSDL